MTPSPSISPRRIAETHVLLTPRRESEYLVRLVSEDDEPHVLIQAGSSVRRYHAACLPDLLLMLRGHGHWMNLGACEEHQSPPMGSVEAWARSPKNPNGGWYGMTAGQRGRFADFIPPVLEAMGRAEVDRKSRHPRMRAM